MLEYQKVILEKVSFDENLFRNELEKAIRWLNSQDVEHLHEWIQKRFNKMHGNIIEKAFDEIAA